MNDQGCFRVVTLSCVGGGYQISLVLFHNCWGQHDAITSPSAWTSAFVCVLHITLELVFMCFLFLHQASNIKIYGAFLHNYGRATDTVRKCSASNAQFADITRHICLKSLGGGHSQSLSLEDLLHKPVARVQKNALVLHVSKKLALICHVFLKYTAPFRGIFKTHTFWKYLHKHGYLYSLSWVHDSF